MNGKMDVCQEVTPVVSVGGGITQCAAFVAQVAAHSGAAEELVRLLRGRVNNFIYYNEIIIMIE